MQGKCQTFPFVKAKRELIFQDLVLGVLLYTVLFKSIWDWAFRIEKAQERLNAGRTMRCY